MFVLLLGHSYIQTNWSGHFQLQYDAKLAKIHLCKIVLQAVRHTWCDIPLLDTHLKFRLAGNYVYMLPSV